MRRFFADVWASGALQATFEHLATTLRRAARWYVAHARQAVPATIFGLFAFWIVNLVLQVPTTAILLDFAGIPRFLFVIVVVGIAVAWGAGLIEFRSPMDKR